MNYKEIIPNNALRKFDVMCLDNKCLHQDKELQQRILSWAAEVLEEARENWGKIHARTIDTIMREYIKAQARKRGLARDKKYAPFREYFEQVQKEKVKEYQKEGQRLTANKFVEWFLANLPEDVKIPYRESNTKNKLIQLAQENNKKIRALE